MKAEVKPYRGAPTLFLNGTPVFAAMQWLSAHIEPDATLMNEGAIRAFGEAGVHLYALPIGIEWRGPRPDDPDHFDFSTVEPYFRGILKADPEALFHLRIYIETASWWNDLYPEECEIASDGRRLNMSYASRVWQEDVKTYTRRYIEHLRAVGLYDRVIAYQFCPGVCGEWVKNITSMDPVTGDYSAPMRRYFRDWLRRTYNGEAGRLQSAWRDENAHFDTAEVPSWSAQMNTTHLHFRDPAGERPVIDYYRALSDLTADTLIDFCRYLKTLTNREKLAGAFYGYILDQAWNDCFFGGPDDGTYSTIQRSGHLGLRRVLESPEVDFLVSPYGYAFRGLGGDGPAMQPTETVRLHNTLYIYEEDSRLHNLFDTDGRNYAFENAVAIHQRCMGYTLTHALAIWWFADWPAGTYNAHTQTEPSPFNPWLERFRRLGEFTLHLDRSPRAEVAVLIDDESFYHETLHNTFNLPGVFYQRVQGLPRFGAPHDVYLLQDLIDGNLPPYKLYIFLNVWKLDKARREGLKRVIRQGGRAALWIYGAGYLDEGPSLENMTDLTGFRFGRGDNAWGEQMHVTNFTHPITRDVPQDLFWGTHTTLGPLFHLEDPEAVNLGQVIYSLGRCKPGMGVKEFPEWRSVYISAPGIPAPVLRGIARYAGVHVYSNAGDVLHATPDLLAIHTVSGGHRRFALPQRAEIVYDLYHDHVIARDADAFETTLAPASSALYYTGNLATLTGHWNAEV
jgi:hypothetical protein